MDCFLSTDIEFFLLWKISHYISDIHIQVMHLYLPLLQIFKIPLYNNNYHKFLPYCAQYNIFALAQMIFTFTDQSQKHLVLDSNLEPFVNKMLI